MPAGEDGRLSHSHMKWRTRFPFVAFLAALAAIAGWDFLSLPAALAQQPPPAQSAGESPGDVEDRMQRLEARIQDLQAVIGTLQSFVRDGGGTAAPAGMPPGGGAPDAGGAPSELSIRVLALETQIRALTGQMKEVIDRLDRSGAPPASEPVAPAAEARHPWQQGAASAEKSPPPPGNEASSFAQNGSPGTDGQFASASESATPYGGVTSAAPAQPEPQQTAQLPPLSGITGAGAGARDIYDASYQNFLRNDFLGAEQGFSKFIADFPDDPLATNAYYWLGRSHFERQQYEPAAKAFLAGYKKDKRSALAPDSLLHLGLSLAQLGEKDAACSTLSAISKQYPDAANQLKDSAEQAMARADC
jgi:tol-pal system protein YbgF